MHAFDRNDDGQISYHEFHKVMQSMRDISTKRKKFVKSHHSDRAEESARAVLAEKEAERLSRLRVATAHAAPSVEDAQIERYKYLERAHALEELWSTVGHYLDDIMPASGKSGTDVFEDMFNEYDLNGDGVLTVEELTEGLMKAGIIMSKKKFKLLMQELDKDRSGTISLKEFRRGLKHHGTVDAHSHHHRPGQGKYQTLLDQRHGAASPGENLSSHRSTHHHSVHTHGDGHRWKRSSERGIQMAQHDYERRHSATHHSIHVHTNHHHDNPGNAHANHHKYGVVTSSGVHPYTHGHRHHRHMRLVHPSDPPDHGEHSDNTRNKTNSPAPTSDDPNLSQPRETVQRMSTDITQNSKSKQQEHEQPSDQPLEAPHTDTGHSRSDRTPQLPLSLAALLMTADHQGGTFGPIRQDDPPPAPGGQSTGHPPRFNLSGLRNGGI